MKAFYCLWKDETGFILSSELVLIATICVIGLIGGMTCLRDSVSAELTDVAGAIGSLNQSYYYSGFSAMTCRCFKSSTAGSCFTDQQDGEQLVEGDIAVCPQEQSFVQHDVIIEQDVQEEVLTPVPRVIQESEVLETVPCPEPTETVVPCPQPAETTVPCETCPPVTQDCPCESTVVPQSFSGHGTIPAPNTL